MQPDVIYHAEREIDGYWATLPGGSFNALHAAETSARLYATQAKTHTRVINERSAVVYDSDEDQTVQRSNAPPLSAENVSAGRRCLHPV